MIHAVSLNCMDHGNSDCRHLYPAELDIPLTSNHFRTPDVENWPTWMRFSSLAIGCREFILTRQMCRSISIPLWKTLNTHHPPISSPTSTIHSMQRLSKSLRKNPGCSWVRGSVTCGVAVVRGMFRIRSMTVIVLVDIPQPIMRFEQCCIVVSK